MTREQTVGFLCCSGIATEVARAAERLGRGDAPIRSFRSGCYHCKRPATASLPALHRLVDEVDVVVAVCMSCCDLTLAAHPEKDRIELISLAAQGEAFLGADATAHALEAGCFVTHSGWMQDWREVVETEWGFDRDTARAFFKESSRKILLLDTGVTPVTPEQVAELSEFLALPVEERFVGISHLQALLAGALATAEARAAAGSTRAELSEVRASAAGHAAVVDFVTSLGRVLSEEEVVETLHRLAEALFGASRVSYEPATGAEAAGGTEDDGFSVPVAYGDEVLGRLRVAGLAVPQHQDRYRSLAGGLADASAIAIHAARLLDREKSLTEALAAKVKELDSFASVTAHDLKQPLTAVMGFADLLALTAADVLSDKQRGYLDRLLAALGQMDRLIDEILTLTRVGRQEVPTEEIDLEALADAVLEELRPTLEARGCVVERGPLPRVRAVRRWIHEVLRNLLTNAVKYNDKPRPHIEIGADPGAPGMARLFVRDDGVGIAPGDQGRVFDMFHRLPSGLQTEGTGIGLAIAKKAVEGEGGRIWLQSEPGVGSTFYFTLPR